jgi:hypothetical protein
MKSYSLFGFVGAGCALALAMGACSVTTTNINGDDSGTSSSSGGSSSGGGDDSATEASSGGSSSSSSSGAGDSGGDAGLCPSAALQIDPPACDTCVKTSCCAQLTACDTPGAAGVDDAGFTECENLLSCTLAYATAQDAGLTESLSTCSGGVDGGAPLTTLNALLACASAHCATECR